MKKYMVSGILCVMSFSGVSARFAHEEIEPLCSISGMTHTSFPGEISDTSTWNIPTAYQGACDVTPELTNAEKKRVSTIMVTFFQDKKLTGPIYEGDQGDKYGGDNTLNPKGQKFVNEVFFPAVIQYISRERMNTYPNMKNIAILNEAVRNIGYDYFLYNN